MAKGVPNGYLLALNNTGAAYVVGDAARTETTLVWTEFGSGRTTAVAHPGGGRVITDLSLSDHWIVWVEQDRQPSDPMAPVSWRVKGMDLATGDQRTLVRSHRPTPVTPGIGVFDDTLIYNVYRGLTERSSDFWMLHLGTKRRTKVLADVAAGAIAYDGTWLVTSLTKTGDAPGSERSDLNVLTKGHLEPVTASGRAINPQIAAGNLVWVEQWPDHSRDRVMAQRWPDGQPRVLVNHEDPAPSLGDGFVADTTLGRGGRRPTLIPIDHPQASFPLQEPRGMSLNGDPAAWGHRIAWIASRGGNVLAPGGKLVVVTVSRG